MAMMARFAFLSLLALLGACSSHAPTPPSPAAKPMVKSGPPSFSPVAEDVLFRAIGLVGTPYRWGGNTPDSGFDCSGLIKYVYGDAAGINLPRSTREMIDIRAPSIEINALQSGDLVFFATNGGSQVSHAGIYVGEGRFVHAPSTGGTVRLDYLSNSYWHKAYLQAKRIIAPSHLAVNP